MACGESNGHVTDDATWPLGPLSRQPLLEIQSCLQWSTYTKWLLVDQIVTCSTSITWQMTI